MNYDSCLSFEVVQHIISINIVTYVGIRLYTKLKMETLLALYNPFDPFFNILQYIYYMFIHSNNMFLHITINMLMLWIWGIPINSIFGHIKFMIIYFSSGITAGFLQNMLKIFIIYHHTGIFDLYQISHELLCINKIQRLYLQNFMYSPIIGASGAIASIVGSFTTIKFLLDRKIFLINFMLYNIIVFFKIFTDISHLLHLSGAIAGSYISCYFL